MSIEDWIIQLLTAVLVVMIGIFGYFMKKEIKDVWRQISANRDKSTELEHKINLNDTAFQVLSSKFDLTITTMKETLARIETMMKDHVDNHKEP